MMEDANKLVHQALIADDQEHYRKAMAGFLQTEGYTVDQATNGQEAWDMLQANNYRLVILDLRMPGVNGLEVLRLMRRLKQHPVTIMVTGSKTPEIERIAISLGAMACLEKPMAMLALSKLLVFIAPPRAA